MISLLRRRSLFCLLVYATYFFGDWYLISCLNKNGTDFFSHFGETWFLGVPLTAIALSFYQHPPVDFANMDYANLLPYMYYGFVGFISFHAISYSIYFCADKIFSYRVMKSNRQLMVYSFWSFLLFPVVMAFTMIPWSFVITFLAIFGRPGIFPFIRLG